MSTLSTKPSGTRLRGEPRGKPASAPPGAAALSAVGVRGWRLRGGPAPACRCERVRGGPYGPPRPLPRDVLPWEGSPAHTGHGRGRHIALGTLPGSQEVSKRGLWARGNTPFP